MIGPTSLIIIQFLDLNGDSGVNNILEFRNTEYNKLYMKPDVIGLTFWVKAPTLDLEFFRIHNERSGGNAVLFGVINIRWDVQNRMDFIIKKNRKPEPKIYIHRAHVYVLEFRTHVLDIKI